MKTLRITLAKNENSQDCFQFCNKNTINELLQKHTPFSAGYYWQTIKITLPYVNPLALYQYIKPIVWHYKPRCNKT